VIVPTTSRSDTDQRNPVRMTQLSIKDPLNPVRHSLYSMDSSKFGTANKYTHILSALNHRKARVLSRICHNLDLHQRSFFGQGSDLCGTQRQQKFTSFSPESPRRCQQTYLHTSAHRKRRANPLRQNRIDFPELLHVNNVNQSKDVELSAYAFDSAPIQIPLALRLPRAHSIQGAFDSHIVVQNAPKF
jgi:hypothetical protein